MIEDMEIATGATITVTGGTPQTFVPTGQVVNRGLALADSSEADVRTRDTFIFKATPGSLQPDGSWSRDKIEVKYVSPDLLPDGKQDFPFGQFNLVKSPLWSTSKIADIRLKMAQAILSTDNDAFFNTGAVR